MKNRRCPRNCKILLERGAFSKNHWETGKGEKVKIEPGNLGGKNDRALGGREKGVSLSLDITLVLGGTRSGKSRFAESLTESFVGRRTYIATAEARDREMEARIAQHQMRRGDDWGLVEEPLHLGKAITAHDRPDHVILVECLTLWLSNMLAAPQSLAVEKKSLFENIGKIKGKLILVGNEAGLGITPLNEMARHFLDEAGALHQEIASIAKNVYFVAAGLPLCLKGEKK